MLVRAENEKDRDGVYDVNTRAFETPAEAQLVGALRAEARPIVSLVAEENGAVIGQILFSPVTLSGHPKLQLMGLAPMAVLPERQRQGIGSSLVRAGLEQCRSLGCAAVVVLGHPEYYPRFGFQPASTFGISCEYEVPPEVFMALELQPGALAGVTGTAHYHPAFGSV